MSRQDKYKVALSLTQGHQTAALVRTLADAYRFGVDGTTGAHVVLQRNAAGLALWRLMALDFSAASAVTLFHDLVRGLPRSHRNERARTLDP